MNAANNFTYAAAVIGYGRFGKLWARLLASYFHARGECVAVADVKNIYVSKEDGLHALSIKDAVRSSKAIFLCVPISAMRKTLQSITSFLCPDTLVCDVCSVKLQPLMWMKEILPKNQKILATHPLFGPDSFVLGKENKNTDIVVYPARLEKTEYEYWKAVFNDMGLRIHELAPKEHDRQVAYTQGLTHFIGRVLSTMNLSDSKVSTRGYNALLEIINQTCSDSIELFRDLQKYNLFSRDMRNHLAQAFEKELRMLDDN